MSVTTASPIKDTARQTWPVEILLLALVVFALHLSSLYSYLLFHSVVEIVRIVVVFAIFVLAWHARRWMQSSFLLFVGISYLFVGTLELLHTLSYKGSGVFPAFGANLPTQLWISYRFLEAITMLIATRWIDRRFNPAIVYAIYFVVTAGLIASIFLGYFPDCFVEGKGLTRFKIVTEYVIAALFLGTIIPLWAKKASFDPAVLRMIILSLITAAAAEIAFTQYISVYGPANEIGHYLQLIETYLMYRAVLVTGIVNPFALLFRELKQKELELEARVADRTAELASSEERYRLLVDQAPEAIIVFDLDHDRFVDANPEAEQLFGYSKDELLKHNLLEFYAERQPDRQPVVESFHAHRGEALLGKPLVFERAIHNAKGEDFICEVRINALPSDSRNLVRASYINITDRKRADEALRASEASLREAQRIAQVGSWELDLVQNVLTWSEEVYRIFEIDPARLGANYEAFISLVHLDDRKRVREAYERSVAEKKPYDIVHRIVMNDGRMKYVHEQCETQYDAAGKPVRSIGTVHDITERIRAENALRRASLYSRSLIEASLDPLVTISAEGKITDVNEATVTVTGVAREKLIGSDFSDYCTEPERARMGYREVFANGYVRDFPLAIRNVFGEVTPVLYNASTYRDEKGEVVGVFAAARDITERIHAENALRLASRYTRSLIESSLDPLVTINAEGKITDVNEATVEVTGVKRDRLIGSDFSDYFTEPERARAGYREAFAKGFVRDYPLAIRSNSGEITEVLYNSSLYRDERGEVSGVFAAARDVTERRVAERALARTERVLRTLNRANEVLVHAQDEDELLKDMCRVIVETGGYVMASIGYAEHDEARSVRFVASAGKEAGYLATTKISWADTERGRGPTGAAIRTGKPQVNQNFATNPQLAPWRDEAKKRGYAASVGLPLKVESGVIGSLTIYAADPNAFDGEELHLLVELANDLSYGIGALRTRAERETGEQRLRRSMEATIEALAGMVEMRDPYTAGHQRNVSLLAAAIAEDMGLSKHDVEGIRLAGIVHDIGKIQVPAEILSKPGKLTKIEFELIKAHAQAGYEIVKGVEFPWPVAKIILQHHERLDGSGYPDGLQDGAILIGARILAVADVVEAMMARRPYREALGIDAALAEIESKRGTKFEPAIVDSCVKLFREKGFKFQ